MKKAKVTEITPFNAKPVVFTFENGIPRPEKCSSFKGEVFEDKRGDRIAAVDTGDLVYSGAAIEDDDICDFLVVRNKETNELRLVPVDLARLKPNIRSKRKYMDESLMNKSTNRDLQKQFGSKKAKRATEQVERLKLDVENIKMQLEETVADIEIKESDMQAPLIEENTAYRPPINRKAISIEEVYNLEELVPKNILDTLKEEAKKLLGDTVIENVVPFVKLEILKLRENKTKDQLKKCEILLYVNSLVKLVVTNAKEISRARFQACPYSAQAGGHIMNSFTQPAQHGRMRSNAMKDKTICFILVLCMRALNYQINLETLAKDLKVGVKRLADFSKILAFTPLASNKSIYILKLPLPAQVVARSPKKKSKK